MTTEVTFRKSKDYYHWFSRHRGETKSNMSEENYIYEENVNDEVDSSCFTHVSFDSKSDIVFQDESKTERKCAENGLVETSRDRSTSQTGYV